jgi:hypothetical protein
MRYGDRERERDDPAEVLYLNKYAQTETRVLLGESEAAAVWLNLSQIAMDDLSVPRRDKPIEGVRVEIPRWIARREGLT